MVVLVVFVALGVSGRVRGAHGAVSATGGGYDLEVVYPHVTRAGLAIDFEITVRHPGGFDGPIEVVQDARYFDQFDENAMHPSPSAETADGDQLTLEFDPPESEVFTMRLDTRTGPNVQAGRRGFDRVCSSTARCVAEVEYRTWVLP